MKRKTPEPVKNNTIITVSGIRRFTVQTGKNDPRLVTRLIPLLNHGSLLSSSAVCPIITLLTMIWFDHPQGVLRRKKEEEGERTTKDQHGTTSTMRSEERKKTRQRRTTTCTWTVITGLPLPYYNFTSSSSKIMMVHRGSCLVTARVSTRCGWTIPLLILMFEARRLGVSRKLSSVGEERIQAAMMVVVRK